MEIKKYIGEVWKPIRGYVGLYEVSNFGRVKSVRRKGATGGILLPNHRKDGYLTIALCKEGTARTFLIHRLVAIAFIPNPNNLPCVNHKNEDRADNHVWVNPDGSIDPDRSNLEWCDDEYNNNYGMHNSRQSITKGTPILQLTIDGDLVKRWDSSKEAEKKLKIDHTQINKCCKHLPKYHTAGGFKWEYA